MTVAVCIPTIPPRTHMLARALSSVLAQTRPPDAVSVACDMEGDGAAATRNRAWRTTDTDWVAFLDDDDEMLGDHLATLMARADDGPAVDVLYPWFQMGGGTDPLGRFGMPFDAAALRDANYIPVTVLVRRACLEAAGGFPVPGSSGWPHRDCEDWGLWLRLTDLGCVFEHVPRRTWVWHHHGANTSGRSWTRGGAIVGAQ